jgi:SAM-dependent methyltransferase
MPRLKLQLNLGCGHDFKYEKGWVNMDITRPCNLVADMDAGLPFKDQSLDLVWAAHVLEHRPDLRKTQRELARIVKIGGELNVIVPHYLSPDAWGDPSHCRAFSEESFFPCFWPGFTILEAESKSYTKSGTGNKIFWLHVRMKRNSVEMGEVNQLIGGRHFNKT